GITADFVNIHDLKEVEGAIRPETRAIYIETLGNPNSDIPDIDALAELAHKYG
ncbi:MAG TPA: bifunctional O-acetylhomoserine aminocarboxypropyltransferase/cysteine synthase, partial [Clostridiales bacterium]|nr:bifunctional O-acetylhomoserine aminocarboxypropyltransferase/cysteine synthase [Clostridiales bacterium]